jgi:prepilin-type N-terminal cleavage/methylation domain-containing protein
MAAKQRGFTLIELMVSIVIFSFAIAGILSVAVSINEAFREQRAAVQAEGAVRVPLDFLTDAIRQASPSVNVPANVQDAGTCTKGAITVTNNFTTAGFGAGADKLDLIYAAGAVVTSSRSNYIAGSTSLTVTDASQIAAGDYIVISDYTNGHIVKVTASDAAAPGTLTLAAQCSGIVLPSTGTVVGYGMGSLVIRAQHAQFWIEDYDGSPTLMMDPDATGSADKEPLAEGIEDMQIAVGVDANGSGGITEVGAAANDDEWTYNYSGDTALGSTEVIRAVRLTLIARTAKLFGKVGTITSFNRPAAEDHAASSTGDQYRRRVLRAIVELRNIGGSP